MECRFIKIDLQVVLGLRVFYVPVHIDNTWRLLKHLLDLSRQFDLALVSGPVDFGNERLQQWSVVPGMAKPAVIAESILYVDWPKPSARIN